MLTIRVEQMDGMAVIECKGRIVQSDSVFRLRDVVMEQTSPIIVLDLSEIKSIGGGGLGMLAVLDRWAHAHKVHLKLFSPSKSVMEGLEHNRSLPHFEIASFHEMMNLFAQSESHHRMAA